jgi:hypothetical protein
MHQDEANERHAQCAYHAAHALRRPGCAAASEKLLGEAREHLLARADEIRTYDRRASELARWNVMRCRPALPSSKRSECSANPNSRR